jgi:hypothetical protein
MKKVASKKTARVPRVSEDEIRPEYDFSNARPNPYAAQFRAGVTVVALDADVAAAFPDAAAVNDALRELENSAMRPAGKSKSKRRTA